MDSTPSRTSAATTSRKALRSSGSKIQPSACTFGNFKTQRAFDQRLRKADLQIPSVVAFLATDLDDIAEALRGDQSRTCTLAFDHRIDDKRCSVDVRIEIICIIIKE